MLETSVLWKREDNMNYIIDTDIEVNGKKNTLYFAPPYIFLEYLYE